ncbi:MAG: hypothetical protein HY842_13930 [Bacteroidetes bacterium]|nr:hypothetical protein [Bacteroidota bacterium]
MSESHHIIEKLTLEVAMSIPEPEVRQEQVFGRLRDWMERHFLPELEAALDAMQPSGGQTLRLDRLDLDLGHFSEREFGRLTGPRLKEEVGKLLTEQFSGKTTSPVEPKNWLGEAEKSVLAFLFFLENGSLPWWLAPKPDSISAWETALGRAFETAKLEVAALATVLQNVQAGQRLAGTFSEKFLLRTVQFFFPAASSEVVEFQALAAGFFQKRRTALREKSKTGTKVWPLVFEWLAGQNGQEALAPFVSRRLFPARPVSEGQVLVETPVAKADVGVESAVSESGVYISNAGLVLLHPFLQLFFESLKVAKNGQIVKPGKALQLLQFLATGHTAPEYEMPLNKLLCGLLPEAFVPSKLRLTKKEKAECHQLLGAVIRHWSALKNTSPEGLQGTFLCREGKLSRKPDGGWLLQVEQQTVDILLDNLPWGIGMVKLPWMPEMLWVEWS